MSVPDQSPTPSEMQSFTATGRPFKPRDKNDKKGGAWLALGNDMSLGHGAPDLLPQRYDDTSLITVPVMRPEDIGTANGHVTEKKRSLFSSRRRSENSQFVMKKIPRGEYLKHYAKDEAGQYVGTDEPAADCILRGEDVAKYRGKNGPLYQTHGDDVGSEVTLVAGSGDGVGGDKNGKTR